MEQNKISSYLGLCIVSKSIYTETSKLKWCIREEPTEELDTGWRFFSENDTDEYLADENNLYVCAFEKIIEIEPAITGLSGMPIGTDIQLCVETQKKFLSHTVRMWFADNKTGSEVKIKNEDIAHDSRAFHLWCQQK